MAAHGRGPRFLGGGPSLDREPGNCRSGDRPRSPSASRRTARGPVPVRLGHQQTTQTCRRAHRQRRRTGRLVPEHRSLALAETRARIDQPPAIDRLVVCHGDACAPNTLLHDDGAFAEHVDLGSLGVADRWADLAVAAWSAEWNYGRGYDDMVYDAYGIAQDPDRIAYYRLLWDMA